MYLEYNLGKIPIPPVIVSLKGIHVNGGRGGNFRNVHLLVMKSRFKSDRGTRTHSLISLQ